MMDRWQKQGLAVSSALHALLVAMLMLGPAFVPANRRQPDLPILEFVPLRLVDEPIQGGGQPQAQPPPPPAPPPQTQPAPPTPQPPVPRQEPTPPPERSPAPTPPPPPAPKPESVPRPDASAKPRRLPEISTQLVTRPRPALAANAARQAERDDSRRQAEARARARQEAIQQALGRLSELATSSTEVAVPGPGGEAFANYAQYVKTVYTRAWLVPPDLDVDDASVTASVTIARDGTVISARIVRGSGHPGVDASVQRTLDRVRTIGREFPAGAKEDRRTFTIIFNLRAKRLTG